jgi:hypothetical protein
MMKFSTFIFMLLLLHLPAYTYAQADLNGTIVDSKGKPVTAATVSLKSQDGMIISYIRSDQQGKFSLTAAEDHNGLVLEISSLGYKRQIRQVSDQHQIYNFKLEESAIDLPTVTIKNRPVVTADGDTLNYRLSDFSSKDDRVLGDVLKKIPGIEVAENGKISYNGKSISNFYIDGDNLLDDKYNIATKSISKEAVNKVQVIENDQPIKMLRNRMKSDEVALNITIKEDAKLKLMGQANLGAGAPHKFDVHANGMLFNKKHKGINYVKGNNVGLDPARDLVSHNLSAFLKRTGSDIPDALLSTGAAAVPDLPQNRTLFNQAGLLNVNNLVNLSKEAQIKTNFYYLRDRQRVEYDKYTEIILPDSNVIYTESQHNVTRPDQLYGQVNYKLNKEKAYLNNTFLLDYKPDIGVVGLIANDISLQQRLRQSAIDVSNELSYMSTFKSGNIFSFYSYLTHFNRPESLMITPGLNEAQFNNGIPYQGLIQTASIPSFVANHYFAFKKVSALLVQTYKLGFNFQDQNLKSALVVNQIDSDSSITFNDGINNLHWTQANTYAEGTYDFQSRNEKLKVTLSMPLSYRNIHYEDPIQAVDEMLNRLFVNPGLHLRYQSGIENFLTLSYTISNELGGIDDVYQGVVLKNYRNLYANDAPVSERRNNTVSLGFNYRKAITLLFFNVNASYSQINLNTISSSIITSNLQQRVVLPLKNEISTYRLNGSASKYLFDLRTTVSAGWSIAQNSSNQIQNHQLLPFKTVNREAKVGVQTKVSNFVNFGYSGVLTKISSRASRQNSTPIAFSQVRQQGHLSLNAGNNVYLNWTIEHLLTLQTGQEDLSYLFSDFSARYKANKINTDFELGLNNLANVSTYKTAFLAANVYTTGSYQIPGRMAIFRATFNF